MAYVLIGQPLKNELPILYPYMEILYSMNEM